MFVFKLHEIVSLKIGNVYTSIRILKKEGCPTGIKRIYKTGYP